MATTPPLPRLVERVRRRVLFGVLLSELAAWGALALFAAGTVLLLGRSLTDAPRDEWLWAFLLVAPVPFVAWTRTAPRRWGPAAAAAWIDVHAGASGLLVAQSEHPDAAWSDAAADRLRRAPDPPRPRLGRAFGRVAPALLFAGAAAWVELPEPAPSGPPTSLFESMLAELTGRLGHLQEELDLDPAVATELAEHLARLGSDLDERSPEALFAALDQFEERLGTEAGFAREAARSVLESVAAQAGDSAGLEAALRDAALELARSGFGRELAPALLEQLGGAQALLGGQLPGGDELRPLAEWLRERLEDKVGRLAAQGLVDAPLEVPESWGELVGRAADVLPGWLTGSDPSGGGAVGLTPDEEAPELAARFAPRPLPPSARTDPEHSGVLAVGAAEPTPEEEVRGEWAGLREVRASGGGSAWRRRLSPTHRRAVQSFFTRGPDDDRR